MLEFEKNHHEILYVRNKQCFTYKSAYGASVIIRNFKASCGTIIYSISS